MGSGKLLTRRGVVAALGSGVAVLSGCSAEDDLGTAPMADFAAAGGGEQRVDPWGSTAPGANASLAAYGCYWSGSGTCTGPGNCAPVGSIPAGNGRWGHADLGGNAWEWTLDGYRTPFVETQCTDCAYVAAATSRVLRGGAFGYSAAYLIASYRGSNSATSRSAANGARCARAP